MSPDLSIIVPAYNEQSRIIPTLLSMSHYLDSNNKSYQIIIVDDGSQDKTVQVVEQIKKTHHNISIISHPKNMGKGAAVKTGLKAAEGKIVLFADADGATPIEELARLEQAIQMGADIAIGSRALHSIDTKVSTRADRKFLGRSLNLFVNLMVVPGIADTQCGFKLFTKKSVDILADKLTLTGFSFDIEILYLARKLGLNIKEVAINWTNMPGSKVHVFADGLRMLRDLFIIKVQHRNV